MTDPAEIVMSEPFICCGCGSPFDEDGRKYFATCGCVTKVGFKRSDLNQHVVASCPCAWCRCRTVRGIIDGEPLCQSCCDKWVRGEGQHIKEADDAA